MIEVMILTCLLIIIILLAKDKIVINGMEKKTLNTKVDTSQDIMGKSQYSERLSVPSAAVRSQNSETKDQVDNFELKTKGEVLDYPISVETSDEFPQEEIDLEEEEEDFKKVRFPKENRGYARGLSFHELNSAGQLLQQDKLEPALSQKAAAFVHKIQGTELLYLLENSIDGASRRIADLLNKNVPIESEVQELGNSDDFDIGEFI